MLSQRKSVLFLDAILISCVTLGAALADPLTITTQSNLLPGSPTIFYSLQLTATGGTPPYTWSSQNPFGSLPNCCGLSLTPAGMLQGTPSQIPPANTFTAIVTDNAGNTASKTFTLNVYPSSGTLLRTTVLGQIAAGGADQNGNGGWSTTIYLVNSSSIANSARILFHLPTGQMWLLPVMTQQLGFNLSQSSGELDFVVPGNSSVLVQTTVDPKSPLQQGWADVYTTSNPSSGTLGVFAIFRQYHADGSYSQGTTGGQGQFQSSVALPFDNTGGAVVGAGLVSLSTGTMGVSVSSFDQNGNSLGTDIITLPPMGQTAIQLPQRLPQTAGQRGVVIFSNTSSMDPIAGLGLLFNGGSFTSVPTLNP